MKITERSKEERILNEECVNQQYSYTTREAIATFKDSRGDFNWLPSKEGQTILQHWVTRIEQQRSASNLTKATRLGCFGVPDNNDLHLDDKVREYICKTDLHQEVNFEDDGAGREWILTNVEDIYQELGFYPTCVTDILNNDDFMILWYGRIKNSKQSYFNNDKIYNKVYELQPLQKKVVESMLNSGKIYHQLGLPPRARKTVTVLEYFKRKVLNGEYSKNELWLIALSKSLSSNTSFVNDYKDFGFSNYFNIVEEVSLFVDDEKLIDKLKLQLPENAKVVLVTDEADFASHTEISVERISNVVNSFNVCEQIVMTGTGFGKATKIFKSIPLSDINSIYFTYTDMTEMGGDIVKRNFVNIQYDITQDFDDNVLNIRQSLNDPAKHKDLCKFLYQWSLCEDTQERMGLQDTDMVMVFIKPDNKKTLNTFVTKFRKMYGNIAECMILTGNETSNREAEMKVKKKFNTMRKNNDNRKLVVFSMGMGSRSFSVSKINRVVEFIDGDLTSATIQEFSRCLTFEEGKKVADIIRVGFSEMKLAEQLYLMENEIPDYGSNSNKKVKKFLTNNSFAVVAISKTGEMTKENMGNEKGDIGEFLDNLCKFTDNTNHITTRLINENMKVDAGIDKLKNNTTKVVETSVPKTKTIKSNKGSQSLSKMDERELRNYVNVTRCIPSIMFISGFNNIGEFCNSDEWDNLMSISSSLFLENYHSSEEFKGIVDALVRQYTEKSDDDHMDKVLEYMGMFG